MSGLWTRLGPVRASFHCPIIITSSMGIQKSGNGQKMARTPCFALPASLDWPLLLLSWGKTQWINATHRSDLFGNPQHLSRSRIRKFRFPGLLNLQFSCTARKKTPKFYSGSIQFFLQSSECLSYLCSDSLKGNALAAKWSWCCFRALGLHILLLLKLWHMRSVQSKNKMR